MKQEFKEHETLKEKVLKFQLYFLKGQKTIREIAHLTDVKDNYVRQILTNSMLISVPASNKEQANNLKLLEVMKQITRVQEIIPPNYINPIQIGDLTVGSNLNK
jgi:hypothetical protein